MLPSKAEPGGLWEGQRRASVLMASAEALCSAGIPRMKTLHASLQGRCGAGGCPRCFPGRPPITSWLVHSGLSTMCPREGGPLQS